MLTLIKKHADSVPPRDHLQIVCACGLLLFSNPQKNHIWSTMWNENMDTN